MIKAVFIDGVGRRQGRVIDNAVREYVFPRRPDNVHFAVNEHPSVFIQRDDHRFRLLYCHGHFAVYGFLFDQGPQYQVLCTQAEWTSNMADFGRDHLLCVWHEQDRQIERHAATLYGALVPIADFIRPDVVRGTAHRTCLFIGRTPSEGVAA